jgi:hypothetical protein
VRTELVRTFIPKRGEVTRMWTKLHNEELHDLYTPSIFRIITSRELRMSEHVHLMGEKEGICDLVGKARRNFLIP